MEKTNMLKVATTLGCRPFLTTNDFAMLCNLKPQTVRKHYCINGHCYGVVPRKMPSRRLGWPTEQVLKLLYGQDENFGEDNMGA